MAATGGHDRAGSPRSQPACEELARFERIMQIPLLLSAVLRAELGALDSHLDRLAQRTRQSHPPQVDTESD